MTCSWISWKYSAPFGWSPTVSWPLMSLRTKPKTSAWRWPLVACFSSVKNHNVSGPHLFPSFTTHAKKNPFDTLRMVLQRAQKSLCNRSQFRTLFLPHRFIKIRPSHQRPVSIVFLTICRIPGFPKSEQNRKSYGNVRIWRKRAADRRKNHSNLNKSFGMKMVLRHFLTQFTGLLRTNTVAAKRNLLAERTGLGKSVSISLRKNGP